MTRMVEKRGATVDEATAAAVAELGVGRDDVEVEIVSEGRRGLFGGTRRAHVRVTLREAADGADGDGADRPDAEAATNGVGPGADDSASAAGAGDAGPQEAPQAAGNGRSARTGAPAAADDSSAARPTPEADAPDGAAAEGDELSVDERVEQLNEEADLAADFMEGLLDILELPGDIEIEVDESHAVVNVVEVNSGLLIGRRGATLDALQELVRVATQRQVERRSHVRIDVEGYRQRQLDKLRDRCRDGIAQVRETGEAYRLEPMDAYERKVVHDLVARTGGVTSTSEGVEPRRRVIIEAAPS